LRRPLIIRSYGAAAKKEGSSVAVFLNGKKVRVPLGVIDFVVAFPGVELSANLIKFLSKNNRCIFFVNAFLKPVAWVNPWELESSFVSLKKCQFLLFDEERLWLTKELLKRKVKIAREQFPQLKESLKAVAESLKGTESIQQLHSADGRIGKLIYGELSKEIKPPFSFKERSYYPPKDPVNAVLSFTFSLLTKLLVCALLSKGLEPFLGFFHERRGSHPALASDLIELSRPKAVKFVGELFAGEFFKPSDFKETNGGITIEKEAVERIMTLLFNLEVKESLVEPSLSFLNWLTKWLRDKCST